jgi:16S rRNA (guanine966-N2)-methyltransferase
MRVISGTARGRPLRATEGTRPTADLIKGSIFSILEALAYKRGFEPDEEGAFAAALAWPRVLDLFAGSGALGIEALSRGAVHATFVESNRDAARTLEANLRTTNLSDQATLLTTPTHLALPRVHGPIDLVFADPPYADSAALQRTVDALGQSELLTSNSVVVLEQSAAATPPKQVGALPLASTRRHGRTRITLYGAAESSQSGRG